MFCKNIEIFYGEQKNILIDMAVRPGMKLFSEAAGDEINRVCFGDE